MICDHYFDYVRRGIDPDYAATSAAIAKLIDQPEPPGWGFGLRHADDWIRGLVMGAKEEYCNTHEEWDDAEIDAIGERTIEDAQRRGFALGLAVLRGRNVPEFEGLHGDL